MCGRFSMSAAHGELVHHMVEYPDLDVSDADWIDEDNFMPRYNIAPRSNAPVIRRRDEDNNLVIHTMKWGVVPHWSKHEDLTLNTINARAENLLEPGGMWAGIKTRKRCVVVCDGYFEWLKKGKERLPHFIRRKDSRLMILAGLYDSVMLEGASAPLWTFTVVTTDAAPSFMWLHDRQPVILSSTKDFEAWLDTSKGWHAGLAAVLKPEDGSELECYPVPKEVGKGVNSPSFIQPISQRKDGIEAMFAKQKQTAKGKHCASTAKSGPSNAAQITDLKPVDKEASILNDGKTPKRAIDIDDSLPRGDQQSSKKQKLTHIHEERTKRPTDGEGDESLAQKRMKMSGSEGESQESLTPSKSKEPKVDKEPPAQSESGGTRSKTRVKSNTPKKVIKGVADTGSAKITSFFHPQT